MLRFNFILEFPNFLFFLGELKHESLLLLFQNFILLNGIEVINLDSRDLIGLLLDGDLLVGNGLINLFSLLQEISRTLLNSLLLRSVSDDVISNFLSFGVQRHNRFL
jgi:hypothetical protein